MKKTCYLVCAGDIPIPLEIVRHNGDKIVAVDGGLKHLEAAGITPDKTIGDFDSLGFVPDGKNVTTLPVEKDETDAYAAGLAAAEEGFDRVIILGGVGGRIEHTFANIQLLSALATRGTKGFLVDGGRTLTARCGGNVKIAAKENGFVSVFSLDTKCEGVTLKGLKYPLNDYSLVNTYPIGVSNEFTGTPVSIETAKGMYLVVADCAPDDFD